MRRESRIDWRKHRERGEEKLYIASLSTSLPLLGVVLGEGPRRARAERRCGIGCRPALARAREGVERRKKVSAAAWSQRLWGGEEGCWVAGAERAWRVGPTRGGVPLGSVSGSARNFLR
jgi:hypothetical protein